MNKCLKFNFNFFKYYSKTKCFLTIISIAFVFNFFFTYLTTCDFPETVGYTELAISIIGSRIPAFVNILLFTFNSIYIYKITNNNDLFFLRENNVKDSNKNIIKTITCQNFILFLLIIMILLISLNIFIKPIFGIYYLHSKGTYNIIYFVIFLLKYFAFLQMFPLLLILLTKYFNDRIGVYIYFIYILYLMVGEMTVSSDILITSISDINFKLSYFLLNLNFSSFIFEIVISIFYILLIFSIMFSLFLNKSKIYNFFNKYLKKIKQKYFLYKIDIRSVIKILVVVIILSILINYYNNKSGIDKLFAAIGIIERDSITIFEMLIIVLYSILPIYFALNKFTKNISYQLCNIFLRESHLKFVIKSILSYFLHISFLRIILYLLVIVIYRFISNINMDFKTLSLELINDYMIFISLSAISFLSFIIFYCFNNQEKIKKLFFYIFDFILICLLFTYYKIKLVVIFCIIISLLLSYILFSRNRIKIFEKLDGGN